MRKRTKLAVGWQIHRSIVNNLINSPSELGGVQAPPASVWPAKLIHHLLLHPRKLRNPAPNAPSASMHKKLRYPSQRDGDPTKILGAYRLCGCRNATEIGATTAILSAQCQWTTLTCHHQPNVIELDHVLQIGERIHGTAKSLSLHDTTRIKR